jgi:hypothetical protein
MSTDEKQAPQTTTGKRPMPSWRAFGLLAAVVLSAGIAAGAALSTSPESSLADGSGIVKQALVLLAAQAGEHSSPPAEANPSSMGEPAPRTPRARVARRIARSKPKPKLSPAVVPAPAGAGSPPHEPGAHSRHPAAGHPERDARQAPIAPASTGTAEEGAPKEGNANGLNCLGHVSAGEAQPGSSEQQVRYTFYCNGPVTGYSLESNVPLTGYGPQPIVANDKPEALSDTFSCGGELPGWADNCVGATKLGWENVTGQFSIGAPLCTEPRVDPLLTVTDIYLEKGVPTQGISGPFDLGRPLHCPADGYNGGSRLAPNEAVKAKAGKHKKKKHKHKSKKQ